MKPIPNYDPLAEIKDRGDCDETCAELLRTHAATETASAKRDRRRGIQKIAADFFRKHAERSRARIQNKEEFLRQKAKENADS